MQSASRFVVTGDSKLTVEARSTLHPIHGSARGLSGYIEASVTEDGMNPEPPPVVHVVIPAAQITSGNDLEDREMQKLVGNRANPDIVADLKELRPLGDKRYAARGTISINGTARQAEGEVTVDVSGGERVAISGKQVFDIRKFGIDPPRMLMFRVLPEVTVALDVVAKRER